MPTALVIVTLVVLLVLVGCVLYLARLVTARPQQLVAGQTEGAPAPHHDARAVMAPSVEIESEVDAEHPASSATVTEAGSSVPEYEGAAQSSRLTAATERGYATGLSEGRAQGLAEGHDAGLAEGLEAGYERGHRAARNQAKAAALVGARLSGERELTAPISAVLRERIRAELRDEVRDEVREELDAEVEATRKAAFADAHATRVAAQGIRARISKEIADARRDAELEASEMLLARRADAERLASELVARARETLHDVERRELRIAEREARLDDDMQRVDVQSRELVELQQQADQREVELGNAEGEIQKSLEQIAGLTAAEARDELLGREESAARREAAVLSRRIEQEAIEQATVTAKRIVADSIQKVASEQTAESVVALVQLPSDEMKGRIIGREGRNIRAFEQVTGVNLIIDDTPGAVLLSCFDPVRREVGRLTLDSLINDGRIHPHRIEEAYERSLDEVDEVCQRAAYDALLEVGIDDVHPEIIQLLGRLRFRTSYGQNVLLHLVECAHIAGAMADELGVPRSLVVRGAFLHDIGKAVTHEMEGSHAIVGAQLAQKYGEAPEVVHAIEAHHNEVQPQTIEAVLTQAADSCSGGRPGARRESVEIYVERLQRIEDIASAQPGVEKVFAMQAGREVRIMVRPNEVDDARAHLIAKDVASRIESELTYPGQVRVTVVRESRVSELAK